MAIDFKQIALSAAFSRWPGRRPTEPGYAILLPLPMDMPFLLRMALEGLRRLDTSECRQIVVIPDGWGDDRGRGFREEIAAFGDPRVEMVPMHPIARFYIHRLQKDVGAAANASHWAQIVAGTAHARTEHAFLHDADAFFLEGDALARLYHACKDPGHYTVGIAGRWDSFFLEKGYAIPATWELMFSVPWARRHRPEAFKGRWRTTPQGRHEFDNMLYPEYLDYPSGKVGLLAPPPRIVHFNGAVTTYRFFRYESRGRVVDELFRLLLLALLEDLAPPPDGRRALPTVAELARGLDDPEAPVTYGSRRAAEEWAGFRAQVTELCEAPIFAGPRADRIRAQLGPFDRHFEGRAGSDLDEGAPLEARTRRHGLG